MNLPSLPHRTVRPTAAEFQADKATALEWFAKVNEMDYVVFDTETYGFPEDEIAKILQLSIVSKDERTLFSTLLKPEVNGQVLEIPAEFSSFHGITSKVVENAPTFDQVWPLIRPYFFTHPVVAYNVRFDRALLERELTQYGFTIPAITWLDPFPYYTAFMGEWVGKYRNRPAGYKWCPLPNLAGGAAHDATNDCVSTVRLIELMAAKSNPELQAKVDSRMTIDLDF